MTLPSLAGLSLTAPTAMLAADMQVGNHSTMSLWDKLPPDIDTKIAKLVLASYVGTRKNQPHLSINRARLAALRLMRESFSDALYPINLLYKNIESADHADAFVRGILLILEGTNEKKEMGSLFLRMVHATSEWGCGGTWFCKVNQSENYYNALGENIAAMLQNTKISSAKFQPGGWRMKKLSKLFKCLDASYVIVRHLPPVTDVINNTVSAYVQNL